MLSARIDTEKYSKFPKVRAIFATWGATNIRATELNRPPMKEANIPMPRARPGSPFCAIG